MQAHVWAAVTCGCSFALYIWALLQTRHLIKRAWSFAFAPSQLMLVPTCCCQANCGSLTYAQVVWAEPVTYWPWPSNAASRPQPFHGPSWETQQLWTRVPKIHSYLASFSAGCGSQSLSTWGSGSWCKRNILSWCTGSVAQVSSSVCCQQSYRRGAERHLKTLVQVLSPDMLGSWAADLIGAAWPGRCRE